MKTKGLGKGIALSLILIGLVGCKEEEFYEKEFIDSLSEQHEREKFTDEIDDIVDVDSDITDTPPEVQDSEQSTEDVSESELTPPAELPDEEEEDRVTLIKRLDSFTQSSNGTKLDILWVIDNSGSMGDEQRDLGNNFNSFITEFINKDSDFQMAVTTTDTRRDNAGKAYKNSLELLTSKKLKENQESFLSNFKNLVNVGTRGSGIEKGLQASESFVNRFSSKWLRKDAFLAIVYMSDEEDQSAKSVEAHLKQIQKFKENNGFIKAYSIVNMTSRRRGHSNGFARYKEISDLTGGEVANIKSDFHSTLLKMGQQIAELTEQFPLSKTPYAPLDINVLVDGVASIEWDYDTELNAIKFHTAAIPLPDAKIEIKYESQ